MPDELNSLATTETVNADAAAVAAEGAAQTQTDTTGDAANVAPEQYTFQFPEGYTPDPEALGEFEGVLKESKLSQEAAQKLVNLQIKSNEKIANMHKETWDGMIKTWVDSAKNDKEFGGQNFDANMAVARKAIEHFGTPEMKEMLDLTGAGNNPEMLRFAYRVGKAISEDKLHVGGNPKGEARDPAKILFPSMN